MTTSFTTWDRQPAHLGPDESTTASLRSSRVLQAAVGLVAVQLAFRAWATLSSWYTFDDFLFISRMSNDGLQRSVEPYAGHVMPGGMFLSWLADQIAPYDFRVTAAMLLLMQLLASVGLLVLLVRLFGVRAGILPPLVLYLFCVISVPVAIWWAAGVNQLPLQIALFWGLAAHVQHLRTRRLAPLLQAVGWLLVGLAFYEKTILVLGAIGIVSLSYFATGGFFSRLAEVWRAYRTATLTYVGLGLAYLVTYVSLALNFGAGGVTSSDVGGVVSYLVLQGYAPAVVGGPLHWTAFDQFSLADPGNIGQLASLAVIGLVLRELSRSRSHSLRAWWLVLFFLTCDVVLVAAGRATFVGALISLDYRYQGEMAAVTAIALGCAAMPIIGAREVVARTGESALLDHPRRVAAAVTVVAALSVVSSVQYVWHWKTTMPGKPYFTSLLDGLRSADEPVPLVDDAVPTTIMWPLGYPENLLSHLLVHYSDRTDFVDVSTDHLNVVDDRGHVVPAQISGVRWGLSGPRPGCGYAIGADDVTLPLDGPVAFGGWWVRIGYLSSGTSPVVVTAGASSYSTVIKPGVHALYFRAGDEFKSVVVSGLADGVTLCTDDVTVGHPAPAKTPGDDPMTFRDRSFPALNAVRAAGAIMVLLTHAAFNTGRINDGWVGAMLARFDFGVTLFFVLSGFLLSRPWFLAAALGHQEPSARHYLWKRALRILPLYWVVVVVAFLVDPLNDDATWEDWVSHLTLTQLYRHDLLASSLTQMWSLCTEVAFYLVLPLICLAMVGRRATTLRLNRVLIGAGLLTVGGLGWQVVVAQIPGHEAHYAQWLPGYLPWFMIGLAFAAISADLAAHPRDHLLERLGRDLIGCWILAAATFALACSPLAGPRLLLTPDGWQAGAKVVLYGVAGAFIVLPLVFGPEREGWVRKQLTGPVPFWLGEISYGIFAIHMIVLNLVFRALDLDVFTGRFLTVASLTLAATLVLATLSFYLFEKPILRLKNVRYFTRMEPRHLAPEPQPTPEIAP